MSQTFLFYFLLTLVLGIQAAGEGTRSCAASSAQARTPRLRFFWLTALFDVEANFCTLLALRFTSLTSTMLLATGGVLPFVLFLGTVMLRHRYRPLHFLATALALAGYVTVVFADMGDAADATAPAPVLGDLLCALSAALFACSSLGQETLLARGCSPAGLLRRMQPAAAALSGAQVLLLGHYELPEFWDLLVTPLGAGAPMLCGAGSLVLMYALEPQVIARGGAAFFNASLLTTGVYGSLWALLRFSEVVHLLKAVGYAAVFSGLLLFNVAGPPGVAPLQSDTPLLPSPDASSNCSPCSAR